MISYRPLPYRRSIGQAAPPAAAPAPAGAPPAAPAAAPPPAPAPAPAAPQHPGYTGVAGFGETVLALGIFSAATWIGIRTATSKQPNTLVKAAGWVGGVGSGLMGLLYLGQKVGVNAGLPRVRISA